MIEEDRTRLEQSDDSVAALAVVFREAFQCSPSYYKGCSPLSLYKGDIPAPLRIIFLKLEFAVLTASLVTQ